MIIPLDDLKQLTDCGQRHTMIRWLNDHGWRFILGASGWPKVSIDEFNRHMLGGVKKKEKTLNISAIK